MLLIIREYHGTYSWSGRASRLAGEDHILREMVTKPDDKPPTPSEITQKHLRQHKDGGNLLGKKDIKMSRSYLCKERGMCLQQGHAQSLETVTDPTRLSVDR